MEQSACKNENHGMPAVAAVFSFWIIVAASCFGSQTEAPSSEGGLWVWPNQPPGDCPFEQSKFVAGIVFTGRHAEYTGADTWYPAWASDGNLYSPWTDGMVGQTLCISDGYVAKGVPRTGNARITGDDPLHLKVIVLGTEPGSAKPYGGRYPCGSLLYNGVWYYGTYCLDVNWTKREGITFNWPWLGPFVGFRISRDLGQSWTQTTCTPSEPLFGEKGGRDGPAVKIGAPHFVDFGKNMEHSRDGRAYLVAHGAAETDSQPRFANCSWITGDQVYLIRVKPSPESINDRTKYEYFAGRDKDGRGIWTRHFSKMVPLVDWNNRCGCVTMTYNAGLGRYMMCVTDGWPTSGPMNSYILESERITGPWKLVVFMKGFGEGAYFVNIPSKFISDDGRTAWLCYSANFGLMSKEGRSNPPGSRYAMCLQEVKFPDRSDYGEYIQNSSATSRVSGK